MNTAAPMPPDQALPSTPPAHARRNVAILVTAQAILGAQLPMIFTIAGLVGSSLAPNLCWATLPITLLVAGSMLAAAPLSALMQARGRAIGLGVGALGGLAGGGIGALGLWHGSFALFCLGTFLSGIYMSAHGFYRFAAADAVAEADQPRAISRVMAGGLVAAILGPQLVTLTAESASVAFLGTYVAVIGLNLVALVLFPLLDLPAPPARKADAASGRSISELLRTPAILAAMLCAMVSYALMNLVMTSAPLAMVGCGFATSDAANVVTAHVLAMYGPSFFTAPIIKRLGVERVIALGLTVLAAAAAVGLAGVRLENFFVAMVLLGIGWNFSFIGATTLLAREQRPEERGRLQGLNDALVFGGVTLASLSSGGLLNCAGGTPREGWQLVNLATLPFLVLAGAVLIWFWLRPRETR